jgi:anti-sigma factor RsiW
MDNELRLIQYLYGEEARPEDVERLLAADEALRAEYRRLRAVKEQLDARPRSCPDDAVVDAVVDAAANAAPAAKPSARRTDRSRRDREPTAPQRTPWHRVMRVTAALAVLLVGVSIGVWQWEGGVLAPSASTEPAASSSATVDARGEAGGPEASDDASVPDWDEADDVVRLHRHIETLQARSSPSSWDYPGAELQPASQTQRSND